MSDSDKQAQGGAAQTARHEQGAQAQTKTCARESGAEQRARSRARRVYKIQN